MRVRYYFQGEISVSLIHDATYELDSGILNLVFFEFADLKFRVSESCASRILYSLLTDGYFDLCSLGSLVEEVS